MNLKPGESMMTSAADKMPVTPIEPQDWLHFTTPPDATIQNLGVYNIVIGNFTLHIEPDGILRGSGNADGAAQSFFDHVVAIHNAKLREAQQDTRILDFLADERIFDGYGDVDIDSETSDALVVRDPNYDGNDTDWKLEWRRQFRLAIMRQMARNAPQSPV